MANRRRISGAYTGEAKLPPIRRNYDIARKPMFSDLEDEHFPSRFPRLPRIECNLPLVQRKTPLPFRGSEGNSYSCLTIDEQRPPLGQVAEKCGQSLEKTDGFQELNKYGKLSMCSETCRKDSLRRESNNSPVKKMVTIAPIAENAFRRPAHLLRRRLKPGRTYRHCNGQMTQAESPALDQSMDQLRAFTERDVKWMEVKDFNGKKIDPHKTENGDISSFIELFELEGTIKGSQDELSATKETKKRVERRYLEALDLHFFHYYRNTHPERRMAICEEIERSIIVDDLTLTCFREHLGLQEVMNTWVL